MGVYLHELCPVHALCLCLDGTQGLGAALCYVFVMRQPREVRPTSGVSWHIWLAPASASELQPGLGLARPGLQSSPTRRGVKPCSLTSPKRDWVSTCPSPSSRAPAAYGWRLLSLSTEDSFGTPSGSVCTLYEGGVVVLAHIQMDVCLTYGGRQGGVSPLFCLILHVGGG